MPAKELITSFLGALQACVSVLLTLCYGVIARRSGLVRDSSIRDMSALCVKVFFPALMVVNIGAQLRVEKVGNYAPVVVWSILTVFVSFLLGETVRKLLRLPPWVTPSCIFNNTTSLPLLLVQSLQSAGSLDVLVPSGETVSDAVERAQSYLLVCAVINKIIAYGLGPYLLQKKDYSNDEEQQQDAAFNGTTTVNVTQSESTDSIRSVDEVTTLLPHPVAHASRWTDSHLHSLSHTLTSHLPHKFKEEIRSSSFDSPVVKDALLGVCIGGLIGLVSPLHKAFFLPADQGGVFSAWLTSSVRNLGGLFTSLQMFTVGCRLGVSFERMKLSTSRDNNGENGNGNVNAEVEVGRLGVNAAMAVFMVRFVLWPAVSISTIYFLSSRTSLLGSDPILWFTMMLMPTGPPSLLICGLAELAKVNEAERMATVKALTTMYALSPTISFTITGALKASSVAAKGRRGQP
ncbi:hypothetical protein AJ80_01990 [Polytolypa hystricis UAMH7299]|uniref:Auxin efflux carrier n=1 Tax=Polytolypa hystricis (strain UAMH7299) TaxID=1447883 RepID=A0A2B7YSQ7_POLH7|nr:hypothetical protein AJ80_01990 [Polytolypa hystricis UAMH7299]